MYVRLLFTNFLGGRIGREVLGREAGSIFQSEIDVVSQPSATRLGIHRPKLPLGRCHAN